jgi:hypothetical protein
MHKRFSVLLIILLLSVSIFQTFGTSFGATSSGVYTASVILFNDSYVSTSEFILGGRVSFQIHVEDDVGQNLTSYVYLYVYEYYDYSEPIEQKYINLDYNGNGSGYFYLDSDYYAGTFRIDVKESSGSAVIGSTAFTVTKITYNVEFESFDSYPGPTANITNEYKIGDTIYFLLKITDNSGNPPSDSSVYVMLFDSMQNRITYDYLYLDSKGEGSGYISTQSGYEELPSGIYTLRVAFSLYDESLASKTITLKGRTYFATIITWDTYPYYEYAKPRNAFDLEDRVFYSVHVEDDEGEPYSRGYYSTYVYINLTYKGDQLDGRSVSLNNDGNGSGYFRLYNYEDLEYGKYTLEVRISSYSEIIGTHDFFVLDFELTLDKYEYAPTDTIKITISITPAELISSLNIKIINASTKKGMKHWENKKLGPEGGLYLEFKIPANIPDGDYNVTVEDDDGSVLGEQPFFIRFFKLIVYSERRTYLAGDSATFYYSLTSLKDGSSIDIADYNWDFSYPIIEYYCPYYWQHEDMDSAKVTKDAKKCSDDHEFDEPDEGIEYTSTKDSFRSTTSLGVFKVGIPAVTENGGANLKVNVEDTAKKHSAETSVQIYIGNPNIDIETDLENYAPGDFVIVSIDTSVSYSYDSYTSPLENANVDVKLFKQNKNTGKYDEITEYARDNLITDANGRCECIIMLGSNLKEGSYKFEATLSKPGVNLDEEFATDDTYIEIGDRVALMAMELLLDKRYYNPGDYVKVRYDLAYMDNGEGVRNSIIDYSVYYEPYEYYYSDSIYIAMGRFKSPGPNGSFEFFIPDNFDGQLRIAVTATNETGGTVRTLENIVVNYATLMLNVNEIEYDPGDFIEIYYDLSTHTGKINYYYKIIYYSYNEYGYNDEGVLLERHFDSRSPKGTFNFTVPKVGSANKYYIRMYALDSKNHYTESSIEIEKSLGYILEISLDRAKYYRGDIINVEYKVLPQGVNEPPEHIIFAYSVYGMNQERYETDQAQGIFNYQVPDNASIGTLIFAVLATINPSESYFSEYSMSSIEILEDKKEVKVDDDDSVLASTKNIAKTLGISSFDLILIIIIIIILVLLAAIKRRTTSMDGKEGGKETKKKLTRSEKKRLKQQAKMQKKLGTTAGTGTGQAQGQAQTQVQPLTQPQTTPYVSRSPTTSPSTTQYSQQTQPQSRQGYQTQQSRAPQYTGTTRQTQTQPYSTATSQRMGTTTTRTQYPQYQKDSFSYDPSPKGTGSGQTPQYYEQPSQKPPYQPYQNEQSQQYQQPYPSRQQAYQRSTEYPHSRPNYSPGPDWGAGGSSPGQAQAPSQNQYPSTQQQYSHNPQGDAYQPNQPVRPQDQYGQPGYSYGQQQPQQFRGRSKDKQYY